MGLKRVSKKWSDLFCRRPNLKDGRPRFSLKGAKGHLYGYDGYFGGHNELDRILKLLKKNPIKCDARAWDSPANVSLFEYMYHFNDGGLAMYSGNYTGSPGQGVFVIGFKAFRWLLDQLGVKQPRRFKNEPAAEAISEKSSSEGVNKDISTV